MHPRVADNRVAPAAGLRHALAERRRHKPFVPYDRITVHLIPHGQEIRIFKRRVGVVLCHQRLEGFACIEPLANGIQRRLNAFKPRFVRVALSRQENFQNAAVALRLVPHFFAGIQRRLECRGVALEALLACRHVRLVGGLNRVFRYRVVAQQCRVVVHHRTLLAVDGDVILRRHAKRLGVAQGEGRHILFVAVTEFSAQGLTDVCQRRLIGGLSLLLNPAFRLFVKVVAALGAHVLLDEHVLNRGGQRKVCDVGGLRLVRLVIRAGKQLLVLRQVGDIGAVAQLFAVDSRHQLIIGAFCQCAGKQQKQGQQQGSQTMDFHDKNLQFKKCAGDEQPGEPVRAFISGAKGGMQRSGRLKSVRPPQMTLSSSDRSRRRRSCRRHPCRCSCRTETAPALPDPCTDPCRSRARHSGRRILRRAGCHPRRGLPSGR